MGNGLEPDPKVKVVVRENSTSAYTTADEILFIQDMLKKGRMDVLRTLRKLNKLRCWDGPGMAVSRVEVEKELEKWLGREHHIPLLDKAVVADQNLDRMEAEEDRL